MVGSVLKSLFYASSFFTFFFSVLYVFCQLSDKIGDLFKNTNITKLRDDHIDVLANAVKVIINSGEETRKNLIEKYVQGITNLIRPVIQDDGLQDDESQDSISVINEPPNIQNNEPLNVDHNLHTD